MSDPQHPSFRNPGPPPPLPPAGPPPVPPCSPPTGASTYAAPYTLPQQPQFGVAVAPRNEPEDRTLGLVSLVLALVALIVAPVIGALAAWDVGTGIGSGIAMRPVDAEWDWSILSPVRESVLVGELAFWGGTAVGVWAIVQGLIAIARRRGRGLGIAAVIVAAVAFLAFTFTVWMAFVFGAAAGSTIGG